MRTMRTVNGSTNPPRPDADAGGPAHAEAPLPLRMAAEIALRSVPGRRVLLVAPPHPWLEAVVAERAGDLEVVPVPERGAELATVRTTYETIVALRVLPFLGEDSRSSERRAHLLLSAMAEKLAAGGTLVFDIDNSQSLRGAAYGVRHLGKAIEAGPLVVDTPEGPNRFDTLERFAAHLPPFLDLVELHGVELLYAPALPRRLPLAGPLWTRLEWAVRSAPVLRRLASHLVLVTRHTGGRPADR